MMMISKSRSNGLAIKSWDGLIKHLITHLTNPTRFAHKNGEKFINFIVLN